MLVHQLAPQSIHSEAVLKNGKRDFQLLYGVLDLRYRYTQTILLGRSRGYVPILADVLREQIKSNALLRHSGNGLVGNGTMGMVRLTAAHEHVCDYQIRDGEKHLSAICILSVNSVATIVHDNTFDAVQDKVVPRP